MAQSFRKILCPIDFDDNSIAALDLACKEPAQNDAALCLMHVVPFPIAPVAPWRCGSLLFSPLGAGCEGEARTDWARTNPEYGPI